MKMFLTVHSYSENKNPNDTEEIAPKIAKQARPTDDKIHSQPTHHTTHHTTQKIVFVEVEGLSDDPVGEKRKRGRHSIDTAPKRNSARTV